MIASNEYWKDLKDDGLAHLNMISLHLSQDTEKNDDKSHFPSCTFQIQGPLLLH